MSLYEELVNSSGSQFQDVFTKLMKSIYGNRYHSTATYGNVGDMGVDGVLDNAVAYAVYAPDIYTDDKVLVKIKEDFSKFLSHRQNGMWSEIKQYVFVIKYIRKGVTSRVIDLVGTLSTQFPTGILTLDDLKIMSEGYMPFTEDGMKFEEFKKDFSSVGEYAVKTDFTGGPIRISYPDEIDSFVEKWNGVNHIFNSAQYEELKQKVVFLLNDLSNYLSDEFVRFAPSGDYLIFRSDNHDAIVECMRPNTTRIRIELANIMNEIYYGIK